MTQVYHGTVPHPDVLAAFEQLVPGTATVALALAAIPTAAIIPAFLAVKRRKETSGLPKKTQ